MSNWVYIEKVLLKELNVTMQDILKKCEETVHSHRKKKKDKVFKKVVLSIWLVFHLTCNYIRYLFVVYLVNLGYRWLLYLH